MYLPTQGFCQEKPVSLLEISAEQLNAYRQITYRLAPDLRLNNQEDGLLFVNERGFVFFWPITGVNFPSLWTAVAGNRPVANAHDDPGHVTWRWKDDMLDKRLWYYGKILRGKATMISLKMVPYFYALSENFGDPDHDYLQLYEDGLLSREAKTIFEILLNEGPLDTVTVRRMAHMTGKASNSPFDRALVSLQRDLKILPVGVAQTGAWRYSFIYDLVHRYYPELPEKARLIKRGEARIALISSYFASVGAATEKDVKLLFQWSKKDVSRTLENLVEEGFLESGWQVEGSTEEHFVSKRIL